MTENEPVAAHGFLTLSDIFKPGAAGRAQAETILLDTPPDGADGFGVLATYRADTRIADDDPRIVRRVAE